MPIVCYNRLFWDEFFLTLALKTMDMCHGTIDSGLIKTQV